MESMSSRFKSFSWKRSKQQQPSVSSIAPAESIHSPSTRTLVSSPPPAPTSNPAPSNASTSSHPGQNSSETSLPMNNQNQMGQPPSYTYNSVAGRPTSPMPPAGGQQMPHPLNTNMPYPGQQTLGAPPVYGMQQQQPVGMGRGLPTGPTPYGLRPNPAHEVEGAGRSKASLIVGIDFGTTFSGVAFAFATNNEAREDIITEWPGAGTHTKQKVGLPSPQSATPTRAVASGVIVYICLPWAMKLTT